MRKDAYLGSSLQDLIRLLWDGIPASDLIKASVGHSDPLLPFENPWVRLWEIKENEQEVAFPLRLP